MARKKKPKIYGYTIKTIIIAFMLLILSWAVFQLAIKAWQDFWIIFGISNEYFIIISLIILILTILTILGVSGRLILKKVIIR